MWGVSDCWQAIVQHQTTEQSERLQITLESFGLLFGYRLINVMYCR